MLKYKDVKKEVQISTQKKTLMTFLLILSVLGAFQNNNSDHIRGLRIKSAKQIKLVQKLI